MNIIENIIKEAKKNLKTIILPEGTDPRILEAASIVTTKKIAKIIVIGTKPESDLDLSEVTFISQNNFSKINELIVDLFMLRKSKGLTMKDATDLIMHNNTYFAMMLLKNGYADGIVSGAINTTKDTFKPALEIIKGKNGDKVFSFFLLDKKDKVYLFTDAGLVVDPDSSDLVEIAKNGVDNYELLTGKKGIAAFLSHSTLGSASNLKVEKVKKAVELAKEKYPEYLMDGEFQLDTAVNFDVAKIKAPGNEIAGHANVLVFPDLDSANIGYKIMRFFGEYQAFGPLATGFNKPVNDLSRSSSISEIVGVIAITALQAKNR